MKNTGILQLRSKELSENGGEHIVAQSHSLPEKCDTEMISFTIDGGFLSTAKKFAGSLIPIRLKMNVHSHVTLSVFF